MKNHPNDRVQILPPRPGADEVEPADYVWALWRYRALILGVTLLCGGVAYGWSAAGAPIYQASATVAMLPPDGGELAYAVIVQARNLLQNPAIVERALARHPAASAHLTPGTFISKNLSIERNRDTNLFSVTVTLPDGAAAADAANFISDEAVAAYSRVTAEHQPTATAGTVSSDLSQEARDVEQRLTEARNALTTFQRESHLTAIRAQASASLSLPRDIATIDAALLGERAALRQVLGDIATTDRLIAVSSNSNASASEDGNAGAPNRPYLNPVYATMQTRVSDARARIASLEEQRASLLADQARFTRNSAALPLLELQLTALQSAYDRAFAVAVDTRTRVEKALKETPRQAPQVARISVAERAAAPSSPIAPKPSRSLLLGLALGAFLSVLLALLLDAMRVQASPHVHEPIGVA